MASREHRDAPNRGQPAGRGRGSAPDALDARLLDAAVAAAQCAAEVIRANAGGLAAARWEEKSPSDFVSFVDRAAELCIAEAIAMTFPAARLLAEEATPNLASLEEGIVFVADPLDGTTNFLHGFPAYAVSIGALVDGELRAGVVLDVPRDELFTAIAGEGAWRDGEPITVSALTEPSRALIGTGFPFKHRDLIEPYVERLPAIMATTAGIRRAGAAALDLAAVASGRFDAFWELRLAPWDIAAGILLIREAGGVVTDLRGETALVAHGGLVAGNPVMHRWLLDQLNPDGPTA
ncbi:MAG: inositol monophosphatase [Gemmatimonadaceae bacterium]|nr:inositol monophosphatase [Gemmatimonadaceae bacterium]